MADPRRRAIYESLRAKPKSVAEIAREHPVSRPAVSQHLKVLVEAELVSVRASGTRRFYEIDRNGLLPLRTYIESFWGDVLDLFATQITETERSPEMLPPVVKTITVACPPERAFDIFTTQIATWWPLDKHSCAAMEGETSQKLEIDCREGGEIWETDHKGERQKWGSFDVFAPPARLRILWHINRPENEATHVEVEFKPSAEVCEVTLTHSNWEAFAERAADMREGYNGGWVYVFETRFREACGGATA